MIVCDTCKNVIDGRRASDVLTYPGTGNYNEHCCEACFSKPVPCAWCGEFVHKVRYTADLEYREVRLNGNVVSRIHIECIDAILADFVGVPISKTAKQRQKAVAFEDMCDS